MTIEPISIHFSGIMAWAPVLPFNDTQLLLAGCTGLLFLYFAPLIVACIGILQGAWSGQPDKEKIKHKTMIALLMMPVGIALSGVLISFLLIGKIKAGSYASWYTYEKIRARNYAGEKIMAAFNPYFAEPSWKTCTADTLKQAVEGIMLKNQPAPPTGLNATGSYINSVWRRSYLLYGQWHQDDALLDLLMIDRSVRTYGLPRAGQEKIWLAKTIPFLKIADDDAYPVQGIIRKGDKLLITFNAHHLKQDCKAFLSNIKNANLIYKTAEDNPCGEGKKINAIYYKSRFRKDALSIGVLGKAVEQCAESIQPHD